MLRPGLLGLLLTVSALVVGVPPGGAAEDPARAEAYLAAGMAALEAGDLDRAVGYLEKAVEAAPGQRAARERLAAAVRARGEKHAKSEAQAAAGWTALATGAHDKAIAYFDKALEDWPDNRSARDGLAEALRRQRTTAKAHTVELARLYARRGQWDKAVEQYLLALAADPTDAALRRELADHLVDRPLPRLRARLKAWTEAVNESISWIVLVGLLAIVTLANFVNARWSRRSIQVVPFTGPETTFRDGAGQGMAAIASSQLHAAGFALEHGGVVEPLTALSAKLTDPQAKFLAELVAWFFPDRGFRLEAVVHQLAGVNRPRVTVKLIGLRFWVPRERVVASTTFRPVGTGGSEHETLARLAAAWAEWHVARHRSDDYATDDPRAFAFFVAGMFAQRLGQVAGAASLYQAASDADPQYHKAFNNRGLLTLLDGTEAYASGPARRDAARALLAEAQALFERATEIDDGIAEYWYNLATTLTYRARLEAAMALQQGSAERYRRALALVRAERPRRRRPHRLPLLRSRLAYQARLRRWATRAAFEAQVALGLATSLALVRGGGGMVLQEETAAVQAAAAMRHEHTMLRHDLRLNYNLGCYYVVSGRVQDAREIFAQLAAASPGIGRLVRSDPDLAGAAEILALFPAPPAAPPAAPAAGAPAAPPAAPAPGAAAPAGADVT